MRNYSLPALSKPVNGRKDGWEECYKNDGYVNPIQEVSCGISSGKEEQINWSVKCGVV